MTASTASPWSAGAVLVATSARARPSVAAESVHTPSSAPNDSVRTTDAVEHGSKDARSPGVATQLPASHERPRHFAAVGCVAGTSGSSQTAPTMPPATRPSPCTIMHAYSSFLPERASTCPPHRASPKLNSEMLSTPSRGSPPLAGTCPIAVAPFPAINTRCCARANSTSDPGR